MSTDQIEWWASLPRPLVVASSALLSTTTGDWLLVKPSYREGWQLPGGIVEEGESPRIGAIRETVEEVGLTIEAGALRCVEHRALQPGTLGPPASLQFIFDGPRYDVPPVLTLAAGEIDDARWLQPDEAISLANPGLALRLAAIRRDGFAYLEDGVDHLR